MEYLIIANSFPCQVQERVCMYMILQKLSKHVRWSRSNTVHLRNCRVFCLAGGQNIAMARTLASLPTGSRVTDYISLGVVSRAIPREKIDSILASTGKASVRQRELPAHLVVYYVIALALYMQSSYREVLRCLLEGIQWLTKPEETVRATGKSGISQARSRLGAEPLRRLYEQVVVPIASEKTRGARYRTWRVISLDGSTLDVADTEENQNEFGRPSASRGASAYPQLRFVLRRFWRMARMCCWVAGWEATPPVRSLWPRRWFPN